MSIWRAGRRSGERRQSEARRGGRKEGEQKRRGKGKREEGQRSTEHMGREAMTGKMRTKTKASQRANAAQRQDRAGL